MLNKLNVRYGSKSRSCLKMFLLIIIMGGIGTILYLSFDAGQTENAPHYESSNLKITFQMTGIKSAYYAHGKLAKRIKIDTIQLKPKKFFIFSVNPLNILALSNVDVDIFNEVDKTNRIAFQEITPLVQFDNRLSKGQKNIDHKKMSGFGAVTQGLINKFRLKIYFDSRLMYQITANSVHFGTNCDKAKLSGVTIEDIAEKEIIKCSKAFLKPDDDIIEIPGEYILASPQGVKKGVLLRKLMAGYSKSSNIQNPINQQ